MTDALCALYKTSFRGVAVGWSPVPVKASKLVQYNMDAKLFVVIIEIHANEDFGKVRLRETRVWLGLRMERGCNNNTFVIIFT